jgi:hypothetical protein
MKLFGIFMGSGSLLSIKRWLFALALIATSVAAQQVDPGKIVRDAIDQGASADELLVLLERHDIAVIDATVIAMQNAPQLMAGDITKAALARAPVEQQEDIGYIALTTATGVGSCKVAEVIGMPQPGICVELVRQAEAEASQ